MDPIGTVRQQRTVTEATAIWIRMDPGYPDNQLADTEYTCIRSTAPEIFPGDRCGVAHVEQCVVIGVVPGTEMLR